MQSFCHKVQEELYVEENHQLTAQTPALLRQGSSTHPCWRLEVF